MKIGDVYRLDEAARTDFKNRRMALDQIAIGAIITVYFPEAIARRAFVRYDVNENTIEITGFAKKPERVK